MNISELLRMLIDFKNKESAKSENVNKAPAHRIDIIINNLECNKAFENFFFHLEWIEKRAKETFIERLQEKLKHSEALARLECISLMNMMSQQSMMYKAEDDDMTTRDNQKMLLNDKNQFPYIQPLNTMEDNGIYAWIMAENRQKDSSTCHTLHYGDKFFHSQKRHITTNIELFTQLIEWCEKMTDSKHLAFDIGINFDDENYYDWDTSLLYNLPEKPIWNDDYQQPWKKHSALANQPATSTRKNCHTSRQIDSHSRKAIKELLSTVNKWQRHQ